MITSFRHKGLRKYFESGSLAGIQPAHANRLKMQLAALDTAQTIEDMDIPGFRLHPLKGSERGRWSIWVNGNWRVTFEFENGNAFVLDYEVYLTPNEISCRELALRLGVAASTLNRVLNETSGVSPEMAIRLSKALGRSPESWLTIQDNYDLWQAKQTVDLKKVRKIEFRYV